MLPSVFAYGLRCNFMHVRRFHKFCVVIWIIFLSRGKVDLYYEITLHLPMFKLSKRYHITWWYNLYNIVNCGEQLNKHNHTSKMWAYVNKKILIRTRGDNNGYQAAVLTTRRIIRSDTSKLCMSYWSADVALNIWI